MVVQPRSSGHQIDVVFAIDTTGSMASLIDGARRTVWGIADHIRRTDPAADLRIGLVAYRDNDPAATEPEEYLTKPFALTSDLDAVYAELSSYTAGGGWTEPENVDAGVLDASRMAWRPQATKLVFVVGDAPPASRGDVPTFDVTVADMARRGIVVNAIRVGTRPLAEQPFRTIATIGKGDYTTTDQSGGVKQIATPYDAEIAELEGGITRTTVYVGSGSERAAWEGRMAAAAGAPMEARADRAGYYAKKAAVTKGGDPGRSDRDLVGGDKSIDDVAEAELPDVVRALDRAQRSAEIARRAAERQRLQSRINELAKKRDEYLAGQAAAHGAADGFDGRVKATVEKQMK
jgi:hypothetical protein